MKLGEIYNFLNTLSPFELQESWDNSGLLVGSKDDKVKSICLSLDIDSHLLKTLEKNTLIITHHPLIFKGLKAFNPSLYPASLLQIMVKKNISLISMHTNFDKTHLNLYVAQKVLGLEVLSQEEYFCQMRVEKTLDEFALHVKRCFGLKELKIVRANEFVNTATLTTGSGGDLIGDVTSDCFLSGDIKYHQALMAKENALSIFDIGHYESERYFGEALSPHLKNLSLKVIMSNSKNPFEYY